MKIKTYINGIKTYISISKSVNGAEFYSTNDGDKHIVLGYEDDWDKFVANYFHEVAEMAMAWLGMRYYRNRAHNGNDGAYFFLSHEEFSEVMTILGKSASECLPLLAVAYKKSVREHKKRRK